MRDLKACPACGGTASTGWSAHGFLNMAGWATDCDHCTKGPRVTRFTMEKSQEAWNHLAAKPQPDQPAQEVDK